MPGISIIIPVYNTSQYLRRCLDSVVNQTFKNIEIICVNDGSTDKSADILQEYAQQDERMIIITQENSGAGAARNVGMDQASGKYLYFLDSDDCLELNAMQASFDEAEKYHADIVLFTFKTIDVRNNTENNWFYPAIKKLREINKITFRYTDVCDNIFNFGNFAWNKLFRHKFILKNQVKFQNLNRCNDVYFVLLSMILATKIRFLDVQLIKYYLYNPNSFTSSKISAPVDAFSELKAALMFLGVYKLVERSFIGLVVGIFFDDLKKSEGNIYSVYNETKEKLKILGLDSCKKNKFSWDGLYSEYKVLIESETPEEFTKQYVAVLSKQLSEVSECSTAFDKWCTKLQDLNVKNNMIMDWLSSFITIKQQNKGMEDYFTRYGYYNIAVYGYGKIGKKIIAELSSSTINVRYIIDCAELDLQYPTYKPTDDLPAVDVVIVTAIYDFDEIENMLFDKVTCRIVSANEIMSAVL